MWKNHTEHARENNCALSFSSVIICIHGPPMSKTIRCLQLQHDFVEEAATWTHEYCLHHREQLPPFHCPCRPVVEISNPSLAVTTFSYKRWLTEWSCALSFSCQCASPVRQPQDIPLVVRWMLLRLVWVYVTFPTLLGQAKRSSLHHIGISVCPVVHSLGLG